MNNTVKIIAMYFTQLHAIPDNNEWWGHGFTDWNNVKKAEPLFEDHYQPRVPANSNYYDQSSVETIRAQVNLAKQHGIYGFCHYHYWFDGKQLLETPTNLLLQNADIDFPFCLSWANETWSRQWDGRDHHILIKQTHPPTKESWARHFKYLIKAWSDERAIKINGKPLFVILRPQKIDQIDAMLDFWNRSAKERGLQGLYVIFQQQYQLANNNCLKSFDASFQFQPFNSINSDGYSKKAMGKQRLRQVIDRLPQGIQNFIWSLWSSHTKKFTVHEYDTVWKKIIEDSMNLPVNTFPGAFADWDNTARYGKRATIIKGASPEKFKYWFRQLVESMSDRPDDMNYLFFNAWNEWAESAYIEPDNKYGYEYLEAIRDVISAKIPLAQ